MKRIGKKKKKKNHENNIHCNQCHMDSCSHVRFGLCPSITHLTTLPLEGNRLDMQDHFTEKLIRWF